MSIRLRQYNSTNDYNLVDEFLIAHYQPGNTDGNWLQPAWEYMHHHPALDTSSLDKIGVWEDNGKIVAVAHYEAQLGEAFFQFHPAYRNLRQSMLDYAEQNLYARSKKDGRKFLCAYVNNKDEEFISLVKERGYTRKKEGDRPLLWYIPPNPFPSINIPNGFRLKSLADDCKWIQVNRVLWRGFNHEGEPPNNNEDIESRKRMFDTPTARRDLKIVVEAPTGDYVSFSGIFYVPTHKYVYIEPVVTDPDYRRKGLGKAAVLEGIRRCSALGATVAYVGSDQAFYQSMGFSKVHYSQCWENTLKSNLV